MILRRYNYRLIHRAEGTCFSDMKFVEREFIPFILGGDINCYSVARAFYEEYKIKTYVFGKYPSGPSYNSKITEYSHDPRIEKDDFFLEKINAFAKKHSDKKIILMGASDGYVAQISRNIDKLGDNIIAPYPGYKLMQYLQYKDKFYELCDKHNIDYPDTIVYDPSMGMDFEMNFPYPVILKPTESTHYWEHPYPEQQKIFVVHNRNELNEMIRLTYEAGYPDKMIIQDMIPGNDENMNVLTAYSDHNGKVKMMCLGHVLLEEHTPHGQGNHAIIITEPKEELMMRVKNLLEDLNYVGFSNFDIKFDMRDGKYKFFEINTRQGRSNFYVTGSGFNIAKYIVDEYIYHKEAEFSIAKEKHLWMVVPKAVAFKYVKRPENLQEMKKLIKEKKRVNPVFMHGDYKLKRLYAITKTHFSHFVKFHKYYK